MTRKPREILMPFVDDMVLAIMAGRKTNTRRELKPQPQQFVSRMAVRGRKAFSENEAQNHVWNLPYQVGDRIGVRESAKIIDIENGHYSTSQGGLVRLTYRADGAESDWIEYPSRLMWLHLGKSIPNGVFREGVRTWLEVTGVRIERINAISRGDAMAEGCPFANMQSGPDPRDWFRDLWESIYGEGSFDNRWVIVTEFNVVA